MVIIERLSAVYDLTAFTGLDSNPTSDGITPSPAISLQFCSAAEQYKYTQYHSCCVGYWPAAYIFACVDSEPAMLSLQLLVLGMRASIVQCGARAWRCPMPETTTYAEKKDR